MQLGDGGRVPVTPCPGGEFFRVKGGSIVYPPALLLSVAGLLLSFVACYPGVMTWDSFVMWGMGWIWPWHDWHSPYIAFLMGISRRLLGDPSSVLLLQLFLGWGGLYLSACALRRESPLWGALLPLLGFTPMFLVVSGYLHKTPLQASVFLFVFGVLFYYHSWDRKLPALWLLVLTLLLMFGIPLREFGFLCSIPLGVLLFHSWFREGGTTWVAGYVLAAVVLSGMSLAVHEAIAYRLLNALRLHKTQTLYRYDLAAVYALTGVDFAPGMIRMEYSSHGNMRRFYDRENGMWRIMYAYEGGIPRGYAVPKDIPERALTNEEVAYYRGAWLKAVKQYPGVWLQHKLHAFATALGVGVTMDGWRRAVHYRSRQNVYGLEKRGGVPYRLLNTYMRRVKGSLLLKPWVWLSVTASLLVIVSLMYAYKPLARPRLIPILALLVSAALFYPQLFLVALDNDIRFSYWAIVATAVALYCFLATASKPLGSSNA